MMSSAFANAKDNPLYALVQPDKPASSSYMKKRLEKALRKKNKKKKKKKN
jgi:hypothetical protein